MSHSKQSQRLDDLLAGAVDLRSQPDFAQWRQKHPEAIEALTALPTIIAQRRSTMIRNVRYAASAAAVLLVFVVAWWMLWGHSVQSAWAEAIGQLSRISSATCTLHEPGGAWGGVCKTYLEGSRVRLESPNQFCVMDFLSGKMLWAENSTKIARIIDMKKDVGGLLVLGSNPLSDLMQMKSVPAERLPDEVVDDTKCHVFRVKDVAFMGYKTPWVKLWLDSDSKLPVQIHAVVGNRMAMTFDDFRWNEPFDTGLLEITVPKGYKLVAWPESESAPKGATSRRQSDDSESVTGQTKDGVNVNGESEISLDEIPKLLDMLGHRMEVNFKAIKSWSGTVDVTRRFRYTNPRNPQYEELSHGVADFFLEPEQDRIRINYRSVEPVKIIGNTHVIPVDKLPESHWIRTPEQLVRFPVSEIQHKIDGFRQIKGLGAASQAFRVLYREPPMMAIRYTLQGYVDPRSFFGDGHKPFWKSCFLWASALRGERGAADMEYAKKNMSLRKRANGEATEYVFVQRMRPAGSGSGIEVVFSSEAGFNVVSQKFLLPDHRDQKRTFAFHKEKGIFVPCKEEFERYEDRGANDPKSLPTQHHVFTLKQTQINEAIDPAVFEIRSMGLRYGDRLVDQIEHRMLVFDGKEFVPADNFKLRPASATKREDSQRADSTNHLKMIALALHEYAQAHQTFPPAYVAGKDGKPLLSWRVLILPYLQRGDLFKRFHLDEPWDSPHNKLLIAEMPAVYQSPGSAVSDQWKTNYLTARGEDTVFPGAKGIGFADIRDGTSNTIMTVEVSDTKAVIWTKPDDYQYDPQKPMQGLVGVWPDGFLAGLADGSVRFVWSSIDPTVLKALFTRSGGEKIDPRTLEQ